MLSLGNHLKVLNPVVLMDVVLVMNVKSLVHVIKAKEGCCYQSVASPLL